MYKLAENRDEKVTGMPTRGIIVLAGQPKTAKTTLAASAPDSYVFELDQHDADRVKGRIDDIKDLNHFREAFDAVLADPSIKTIAIDTFDTLNQWVEDEVAKKLGLVKIEETKPGVDGFEKWGECKNRMLGIIDVLNECGKLVLALAHYKEPKVDENGNILIPAGINIRRQANDYLLARAVAIGYTAKRLVGSTMEYSVSFQGGPLGRWGSRIQELNDLTIRLPKTNPWSAIEAVFKAPTKTELAGVVEKLNRRK